MRNAFVRIVALLAPLALVAAADTPKPGDMVGNPPYENWASFPVGTTVTQKETVQLNDGSTLAIDVVSKLISKTKENVVVETTMGEVGAGAKTGLAEASKTLSTFPAKVKMSQTQTPETAGTSVTHATEAIAYQGKTVTADIDTATVQNGDDVTEEKIWTLKDVPGGIVRRTVVKKRGGVVVSSSTLELIEVKAGS